MTQERAQRRLAAILAADVVGYSQLMEADEAGTLAALKERRKTILEPTIRSHGGRIVKVMGDGVLVEFGSAVNAVNAAVELQQKMANANETISDDRHIVLRIGINLGDIVGEGSDVYGDGVNIAARLEALSEPAGICISGKVFEETTGKLDAVVEAGLVMEDMGEVSLKNITRPIRAYLVRSLLGRAHLADALLGHDYRPSVAVLPFVNMSGDPEQEYFVDGITEDIITELSRFRILLVIARNSCFTFKGKAVDVRTAGQRLGARYVVEGSIRKIGSRLRVTAQLIDTDSGNHVWSERYDRELQDVFAIQDELTAAIVGAVAGQVQTADIGKVRRRATRSLAAYDEYLRGLEHYNQANIRPAREGFERAIAADPNFAPAYAMLSKTLLGIAMGYWGPEEHKVQAGKEQALAAGQRAVALDPNDARGHAAVGGAYMMLGSFELAAYHHKSARELNPNDADVIAAGSYLEAFGDEPEKALALLDIAKRLCPIEPYWYHEPRGIALYGLRRYAEAADVFERASAKVPYSYRYLAACYAQMGEMAKAKATAAKSLELQPDFHLAEWTKDEPYRSSDGLAHMLEGLRKAGLPE